MQVHLWSSKCGRNESQKERGREGDENIELKMKHSNKITFFHFCLLWAKVLINPCHKSLFCSHRTSQRRVKEFGFDGSKTGFRSTAFLFQWVQYRLLFLLTLSCKNVVKIHPSFFFFFFQTNSVIPKLFLSLHISRKHCATFVWPSQIKYKCKPLFCNQIKRSDGELGPVKDKERPPRRELPADYENVWITVTWSSAMWWIAPFWQAQVSQDALGAQSHCHLPQVSFQGKLGWVGGQFILIVCNFLWELQRTNIPRRLSALQRQRRRPPRLLMVTERQKLLSACSLLLCWTSGATRKWILFFVF